MADKIEGWEDYHTVADLKAMGAESVRFNCAPCRVLKGKRLGAFADHMTAADIAARAVCQECGAMLIGMYFEPPDAPGMVLSGNTHGMKPPGGRLPRRRED